MLQLKFPAWFGNLGLKIKNELVKIINAAGKVSGKPQTFQYHIWHCGTHSATHSYRQL